MDEESLRSVLSNFPTLGGVASIDRLTGGMSRDETWCVVESHGRKWVLKRVSADPESRRKWVWRLNVLSLPTVVSEPLLPHPAVTQNGAFFVEDDAALWIVLSWMPGRPLLATEPSVERFAAAARALAQTHIILSRVPAETTFDCVPSGLLERCELLREALRSDETADAARVETRTELRVFAQRTVATLRTYGPRLLVEVEEVIARCSSETPRRMPCLRDVRPEHVMFAEIHGDSTRVSGLIDVGALRVDAPIADLARLTQSWRRAKPDWYAASVAEYDKVIGLTEFERTLLVLYDRTSRVLSCVNWIRWLCVERIAFRDMAAVSERLRVLDTLRSEEFGESTT
ncbi:MAG: phosphotransferase [Pirellulales bacterium]